MELQTYAQIACVISTASACLLIAATLEEEDKRRRKRKCWVKDYRKTRKSLGNTQSLMKELSSNLADYRNFLRMTEENFYYILTKIRLDIQKQDTTMRAAISPEEKLAITLRFLATGESYIELDYNTKVSKTCLSLAIIDVCDAINKHFKDEFLKFPNSKEEWCRIADDYALKWQFPNCVGSIDGKHIAFRPIKKEAALFYNHKGYHSIVLLGVADAFGKFIFIDVGCNGRISDGGVLQRSHFNYILQQPENYLPPKKIIGNSRLLPYVFVGDNAFPLSDNLITPYTFSTTEGDKKIFNFRLSRARQTIERALGMLSNRFQIFQKSINLHQSKVKKIVLCCCILHNFLITRSEYYSGEYNIGDQNRTTERMTDGRSKKNNSKYGESVRNELTQYFNNEGAL